MSGKRKLGMGTNPSSANAMTLVSAGTRDKFKGGKPNVRVVHLNGISVELVSMAADGSATVHVRSDDTFIDRDLRWCADSVVLHAINGRTGHSLDLAQGRRILIDRSRTPTRLDRPEEVRGVVYFSDPTRLIVENGASVHLGAKAQLTLINGSEIHLLPGSVLDLEPSARLSADASSRIVLHGDARIEATPKQLKKLKKKRRLVTAAQ